MTINELEQGIRNLVASQPMVMSGASGEVVNGVLSMIDAFRNLSFKVQTYPYQDVLKYNMTSELQKLENNFSSMASSALQERGINLLLYVPRASGAMGSMVNQYGVVQQPIDSNMLMGQMMYQQPVQTMNTAQPYMQNMGQQVPQQMVQPQPYVAPMRQQPIQSTRPQRQQPYSNGLGNVNRMAQGQRIMAAPQQKIKPEARPVQNSVKQNPAQPQQMEVQKANSPVAQKSAAVDEYPDVGDGKAAGRDYLMELLKK